MADGGGGGLAPLDTGITLDQLDRTISVVDLLETRVLETRYHLDETPIAFDVVTGTALGCGGYAIAILAYILNKGKYHPLVRPALLTSALGYSMAALAIIIDVGRWWGIWRIPLGGFPDMGKYNWNSALLEVALCIMAYAGVLWIELGLQLILHGRRICQARTPLCEQCNLRPLCPSAVA